MVTITKPPRGRESFEYRKWEEQVSRSVTDIESDVAAAIAAIALLQAQINALQITVDALELNLDGALVDIDALKASFNTGWVPANEGWTYASATTITVATDATTKYQIGDKIKLTQSGTVKYFYIVGVSATLLTIYGGNDYTFTNSANSDRYYSKSERAVGFPDYFSFTPTINGTGGSGLLTFTITATNLARLSLSGRTMTIHIDVTGTTGGTTNTDIKINSPLTLKNTGQSLMSCAALDVALIGGTCRNTNIFNVRRQDSANWGLGVGREIWISGPCEIA